MAPEKCTVFRTVCLKGRELEQLRGGSRLTLVEGGQSMLGSPSLSACVCSQVKRASLASYKALRQKVNISGVCSSGNMASIE